MTNEPEPAAVQATAASTATILKFPKVRLKRGHARTSSGRAEMGGLVTSDGHGPAGQLSENHCMARASRRTWMSAPASIAASFLPSSNARELTVVSETSAKAAYARATFKSESIPSIPDISVSLPDQSTAMLPDAQLAGPGHPTGMEWQPLLKLIDKALTAKGLSADKASRDAGHPDAIRNMKRKADGKLKGGITFDTVMDIARVLEISPVSVCRAAMGLQVETDERAALRKEILQELIAEMTKGQAAPAARKPRRAS